VMMTANTPSLKASMRPLVILPTPFFGLRVKREQPNYVPLPPNAHLLGFDAEFSQETRWCISCVDSSALCTKSLNAVCATGQGSRTSCLLSCSDMISAGELPNPVGLFPLGLVPAESLGANEAAATPRP
jgi:hypothetical protein